jgi:hypothetical protein
MEKVFDLAAKGLPENVRRIYGGDGGEWIGLKNEAVDSVVRLQRVIRNPFSFWPIKVLTSAHGLSGAGRFRCRAQLPRERSRQWQGAPNILDSVCTVARLLPRHQFSLVESCPRWSCAHLDMRRPPTPQTCLHTSTRLERRQRRSSSCTQIARSTLPSEAVDTARTATRRGAILMMTALTSRRLWIRCHHASLKQLAALLRIVCIMRRS